MKAGKESKGLGGGGGGAPPADLLVCFPSRAHLALMPKPICSPVRSNSEPNKRHLKKINTKGGWASTAAGGGGPASPLFWAKGKQMPGAPEIPEPTSPKVTCAGQIKVRPRSSATATTACRNWQSVMEEIERLHSSRSKHNKKSKHWGEALGFKKDIINFLTCLGNLRFDFRCLGSFPDPDMTSDEDGEDDDEEENDKEEDDDHCYTMETAAEEVERGDQHNTVFSKWFMVLQENQHINSTNTNTKNSSGDIGKQVYDEKGVPEGEVQVPPLNALLLMRCRSAPATKRSNWVQTREHVMNGTTEDQENEKFSQEQAEEVREEEEQEKQKAEAEALVAGLQEEILEENSTSGSCQEQPKKKKRQSLAIVMKYDADFYDLPSDVSQETWLAGNAAFRDTFSRSRSWKR